MKIIKEGLPKEELEKVIKKTKRFMCKTCWCVFEADKSEYHTEVDYQIYTNYYCECPNCGKTAYEVKMR